jgi:hypothetical protein
MTRQLFNAVCDGCKRLRPRCATCLVVGTNAYGDRESRVVTMCGPCRRQCRGRVTLHPKHKTAKGKGG